MKIINYFFLSMFLLTLGCSNHPKIERIELDSKLEKVATEAQEDTLEISRFTFCELIQRNDWDEVAILSPYIVAKQLENGGIKDYNQIFDDLETMNDSKCSFLFLQKKRVIAYSIINRGPINFSKPLVSIFYLNKVDCSRLKLKKMASGFDLLVDK
ncbi:hypothetical protein [Pedobacter sp. B4-66]|uniref:hypothetical protein n=1 Tax=Pedobacter sp. B4-66 TaxID=2817280 RepID=UPI001BDA121A|nr:hypothetical protein [Pedobacter sp. B4-66]